MGNGCDARDTAEVRKSQQPECNITVHEYINHLINRKEREIQTLIELRNALPYSVNSNGKVVDYIIKLFHNLEKVG